MREVLLTGAEIGGGDARRVEITLIVRRLPVEGLGRLAQHCLAAVLEQLHHRRGFADQAGVHHRPVLHFDPEGLARNRIGPTVEGQCNACDLAGRRLRILVGQQAPVEADFAPVLDGMGGFGETLQPVAGQPRRTKVRMLAVVGDGCGETTQHLHGAGDGVGAGVGPARVRRRAVYDDLYVDAAAIAQLQFEAVAIDEGEIGANLFGFHDVTDCIVLSGFTRHAANEREASLNRNAGRTHRFNGVQHRRHAAFLLAGAFAQHGFPGQTVNRGIDDFSAIGIAHRRGRLVHGMAHQHQGAARAVGAGFGDEVSHGVQPGVVDAQRLHPWQQGETHELA